MSKDAVVTTLGTLAVVWSVRWYWREDIWDLRSTWEEWRRKQNHKNRYWT